LGRVQEQRAVTEPGPAPGADQGAEKFKRPDIQQFIPPDQADAVRRISAAGMKMMYSPDMRDQLMSNIKRNVSTPQKLAEAVTGLMLTLDKQSRGGLPVKAIFPAAMELLGEAAEVLSAAGQPVSQQDYNDAATLMFALIGRKLGGTDQQIMSAAQKMVGGSGGSADAGTGEPAGVDTAGAAPDEQGQPV
jgi:hypothetical protein